VLRLILLFVLGLGVVALALWASSRRAAALGSGAVVAGALVALLASLLVDCRLCLTGPLAAGTLMSLPFFAVGAVALAVARHAGVPRALLLPAFAAGLFQVIWAVPLTRAATFRGDCPCSGLVFNGAATGLTAIGIDRAVGPILIAEALLALWLAWKALSPATAA
jgi:hypothetical protein